MAWEQNIGKPKTFPAEAVVTDTRSGHEGLLLSVAPTGRNPGGIFSHLRKFFCKIFGMVIYPLTQSGHSF